MLAGLFTAGVRLATRDAPGLADRTSETPTPATPSFVPIVSEPVPAATLQRAASAASGIEIKLSGAVVLISSGMNDAAQLTAVLRAVRASASRS
jgi:hypothetical protein